VASRNISLTPTLDAFVNDCVGSGRFGTASEVFRAGLRLLQESEERQRRAQKRLGAHAPKLAT